MSNPATEQSNNQAVRAVAVLVGLIVLLAFLTRIVEVLMVFALASIFSIALSPVVNWLEKRKFSRGWGALIVLAGVFAIALGLYAIIAPLLKPELRHLYQNFPGYLQRFTQWLKDMAAGYPSIQNALNDPNLLSRVTPSAEALLGRVGHYSLSAISVLVGILVTITLSAYMLAMPRPLIRSVLQLAPVAHRDKVQQALVRGSEMVVRWVWANAIIGLCDGILATIVLSLLGIPGAVVWGAVTLFSELIPQIGAYLMAIPPTIVALATDPPKAIWVIVFYVLLQQLVNHLLAPLIRARNMKVHPVSEIFAVLSLTLVFGIVGAIVADPVLGFVKAFYDAFHGEANEDASLDARAERVLQRENS